MRSFLFVLLFVAFARPAASAPADDCVTCHRSTTPAAVRLWESSAHRRAGVECASCHGTDHEAMAKGRARVGVGACAPCHPKAFASHSSGRHGMGLHSGWGCTRSQPDRKSEECSFCHEAGSSRPLSVVQCARFLKQSLEMRDVGCNSCHSVETSCASCHSNHSTDLKIVRDPAVCAKCHMGPDHPQWEIWQTSRHGFLFVNQGGTVGPACQSCHMAGGSHDVSVGITASSGGEPLPADKARPNREAMLRVCSGCHAKDFARRELERGDAVLRQGRDLVRKGEEIVEDLFDHRLLDPMPDQRPPHPLRGGELVTDSQILFEDTSRIERLFFKLKKFDFAVAHKGAYHQNPAYAHWYGNAEMKMTLVDIDSEARRLRERRLAAGAEPPRPASIEERLRALKLKWQRGVLSDQDYDREKQLLLEELSGGK